MTREGAVVVGVDLEAAGDEAIRAALRAHGNAPDCPLLFVFALDLYNLPDAFGEDEFDTEEEALERAAILMRQRIERVASAERRAVGAVRVVPRAGKPAAVLQAVCSEYAAELLIVGTHARRGLGRWMLGSVAETMVREAPCPVLVARPTAARARAAISVDVLER